MTSQPPKPEIAFIGLGAMGLGMATHLVSSGRYHVTGYDLWEPSLAKFRDSSPSGARTASSPAEAALGKQFCIIMVANAKQAQDVLFGGTTGVFTAQQDGASSLAPGASLLLCSSLPSQYVRELENQISALGRGDVHILDCPVSGGVVRAGTGQLSIMVGASSDAALQHARPVLEALSAEGKLYVSGRGLGAGSDMKMCHQVLAASHVLGASEGLGFASCLGLGGGLGLARVAEMVQGSDARSYMLENRLPRILVAAAEEKEEGKKMAVASALTIMLKDAGIITSEAGRRGFPVPMTSVAHQVFVMENGRGRGADDDGSLIRLYIEGDEYKDMRAADDSEGQEMRRVKLVQSVLRAIHLCAAAEALALGHECGLDLEQLLELCVGAAGGSAVLERTGMDMIRVVGEGQLQVREGMDSLGTWAEDLQQAVDEAQKMRVPLHLGCQALSMMRLAQRKLRDEEKGSTPVAEVVRMWLV